MVPNRSFHLFVLQNGDSKTPTKWLPWKLQSEVTKMTDINVSLEHLELFYRSGTARSFLYQQMKINQKFVPKNEALSLQCNH